MAKKNRLISWFAVAAAVLLLAGCGGGAAATGTSAPGSQIPGYYSAEQSVGGGSDMSGINLKDIQVVKTQADTEITLEFVEGKLEITGNERPINGVPKFTTQWLPGLNRLVLSISGLYYRDYRVYDDELVNTPILGIFRQSPVNSEVTKLYINLKDNVAYKITVEGNRMHLFLRSVPEEDKANYYVLLNAFDEYSDGKVSDDYALSPTLCMDKVNVTLISKPYANKTDADAALKEIQKSLLPDLPGKMAVVQQLKSSSLPVYDAKGVMAAYANTAMIRTNGTEKVSPAFITNGRFLCWNPTGTEYIFATPFYLDDNAGSGLTRYEKLYKQEVGAKTPQPVTDAEYTQIIEASYSDDAKYLAFLVQQGEKQVLYVFDTGGQQPYPYTASEAGFGDYTASFTWGSGDSVHTIYGITGEDTTMQLMSYELQDKQPPKVQTLSETSFSQGSMDFFNGKLYYSQYSSETGDSAIYCFNPLTRTAVKAFGGSDFTMNRKAGKMAVLNLVNEDVYDMEIRDLQSSAVTPVCKSLRVGQVAWSLDGTVLYYTISRDNATQDDRFQMGMHSFNTFTKADKNIGDIVQGNLFPSEKTSDFLLMYLFQQQEDQSTVPITYQISSGN